MGLFGKKKNAVPETKPVEETNKGISDEMKIILAAREEEKQEKQAKAEERQQAQAEEIKKDDKLGEQAKQAAEMILSKEYVPAGMTFFMVCDEIPMEAAVEKEGNIIVRGEIRGCIKKNSDVFLYQGDGQRYSVRIEKVRNDRREYVDELSNERGELEITRGDIPLPTNPDENASRPVMRFAVLTDAKGIENTDDPNCEGMAMAGNPRTIAMLCEYGRYGKEPMFFGETMDSIMTSELVTIAGVTPVKEGLSYSFVGVSPKQNPKASFLPVFTDYKLARLAMKRGFSKKGGPDKIVPLSFANVAAISRNETHQGFLINPGGPVTITIPRKLIDDMVKTDLFKKRFGEGAGERFTPPSMGAGVLNLKQMVISNPTNTPEFLAVEKAVKSYCAVHLKINRVLILVAAPADNRNDKSYLCIIDCPEESFKDECQGLVDAMKPSLKTVKKVQFQLFSKMNNAGLPDKITWLYSK